MVFHGHLTNAENVIDDRQYVQLISDMGTFDCNPSGVEKNNQASTPLVDTFLFA